MLAQSNMLDQSNMIDQSNMLAQSNHVSATIQSIERNLLNTLMKNNANTPQCFIANYWVMHSPETKLEEEIKDKIILITQFYISPNKNRQKEIVDCLIVNLDNPLIDIIYLITEQTYTEKEMNISSHRYKSKVVQLNIGARLKYSDVFDIIEDHKITGYIILANSDMFFDDSLITLYKTGLITNRKLYSQLRFEYDNSDLKKCKLFGPRGDSQDAWIFHSKFNIEKSHRQLFNFQLGVPACDNHINYLFMILGYKVYNEPFLIKIYHNHKTEIRTYDSSTKQIAKPWVRLMPRIHKYDQNWPPPNQNWWRFNIGEENTHMHKYLTDKLKTNKPFIMPRIAGIENNFVELGVNLMQNSLDQEQVAYIQNGMKIMKNNAGIKLTSLSSVAKYSKLYLDSFQKCDAYFEWEPWGDVYKYIAQSHTFINLNFGNKKQFWAFTLDIFHNIYNDPWTLALRGKRILIISPFIKSFEEKLPVLKEIYGVDLFPECSFIFLKPPQTQGDCVSEEFDKELDKFVEKIDAVKKDFDVALCSCGGYGNLVCSKIFDMGKSSIYVGGVLQMYFGVYGTRWLKERPDILRLFMNKHWTRPKEEEQPDGFKKVEGSCYW